MKYLKLFSTFEEFESINETFMFSQIQDTLEIKDFLKIALNCEIDFADQRGYLTFTPQRWNKSFVIKIDPNNSGVSDNIRTKIPVQQLATYVDYKGKPLAKKGVSLAEIVAIFVNYSNNERKLVEVLSADGNTQFKSPVAAIEEISQRVDDKLRRMKPISNITKIS